MAASTLHSTLDPPKDVEDAIENAISFLDTSIGLPTDASTRFVSPEAVTSLMTPPSSSPPSTKIPQTQVDLTTCRIRFLTEPVFINDIASDDSVLTRPLRKILPSRLRKPSRSILKPSGVSANAIQSKNPLPSLPSIRTPADCAKMLESIFKQLAGPTRASRLDAYHTLYNCIKHYNDIPDNDSLMLKMPLFQDFLRRDMQAKSSATGLIDTKLVLQAIKVASAFLYDCFFDEEFTKEFLDFLIDHSITVISDADMPKEVVKNQLHMAVSSRVWCRDPGTELITRMTTALSTIHERVSGNNIQGLRLTMYRELIREHSSTMLSLVDYWLPHVISGLSSSFFATRKRAIDAGSTAGYKLGHEPEVSLTVQQIFDVSVGDVSGGGTFFDIFQSSLMELLKDRVHGDQVPQIWTVIVLLMRGKKHNIDHWAHLTPWFRVVQTCFNASHVSLNLQAWTAWNKLIYAVSPSANTRAAMISALRQPLMSQLQRKSINEETASVRSAAYTNYRCLLYYTLRPTADVNELVTAWKSNVDGVLEKLGAFEVGDIGSIAATLAALFSTSTPRPWQADLWKLPGKLQALHDGGDARLEPAWVHKNATTVIQSSTKLLSAALVVNTPSVWESVYNLWQVVMKCLSTASAKEITSSYGSNMAIAAITNALTTVVLQGLADCAKSPGSRDLILQRMTSLVQPVLDAFDAIHFGERHALLAEDGIFRAVLSPSRRNRGMKGFQAPVVGLVKAYVSSENSSGQDFALFLSAMLTPSTLAQQTRSAKLTLLKDCMVVLTQNDQHNSDSLIMASLWRAIAQIAEEVMSIEESVKTLEKKKPVGELGQDYQIVLDTLLLGLRVSGEGSVVVTTDLFFTCCKRIRDEVGNAGCLLALLQPLLRALAPIDCQLCSLHTSVGAVGAILFVLTSMKDYPNQKTLALARKSLSGSDHSKRASESDDSFYAELFRLIATLLLQCSIEEHQLGFKQHARFLDSLAQYTRSTSVAFPELFIAHIISSLESWLTTKMPTRQAQEDSTLPWKKFGVLWLAVCNRIKNFEHHDAKTLTSLESLLCAGFQSWDKSIATITIDLWNTTFALKIASIPSRLSTVLVRLRCVAEIELPPQLEEESRAYSDRTEEVDKWFPWLTREELDLSQVEGGTGITSRRVPPTSTPWTTTKKVPTPQVSNSPLNHVKFRGSKRKSTPRKLRHDDSQTDFTIVNSTPLRPTVFDSQMMTDHQRDVRSRQRADTALFQQIQHGAAQPGTESISLLRVIPAPMDVDTASQAGVLSDQQISDRLAESIVEISSTEDPSSVRAGSPLDQRLPTLRSTTDMVIDMSADDIQHVELIVQNIDGPGQAHERGAVYDESLSLDGVSASKPAHFLRRTSTWEFAAPPSVRDPRAVLEKPLEQESEVFIRQTGAKLDDDRHHIPGAGVVESVEQSFIIPLTESSEEQNSGKHDMDTGGSNNAKDHNEDRTMDNNHAREVIPSVAQTGIDNDNNYIFESRGLQAERTHDELPPAVIKDTVQDPKSPNSKASSLAQRLSPSRVVVEIPSSSFIRRGAASAPEDSDFGSSLRPRRGHSVARQPEPRPPVAQIPSTVPAESEATRLKSSSIKKSPSQLSSRIASPQEDDSDDAIRVLPRSMDSSSLLHSPWARGELNYSAKSLSQASNRSISQKRKSVDSQDSQSSRVISKRRRTDERGVGSLASSQSGASLKRKASHLDDHAASQTSQSSQIKRRRSVGRSLSDMSPDGEPTPHRRRSARSSQGSQILSPSRQSLSQPPPSDKWPSELEAITDGCVVSIETSAHDGMETKPLLVSSHTQENTPIASVMDYQVSTTEHIAAQPGGHGSSIASGVLDNEQSQLDIQIRADSVGNQEDEDGHVKDPSPQRSARQQTPENDRLAATTSDAAEVAPSQPGSRSLVAAEAIPLEAPNSPSRTMVNRARDMYDILHRVWVDARNLILGPGELQERRQLEDIVFEINREIIAAGRRGEGRL